MENRAPARITARLLVRMYLMDDCGRKNHISWRTSLSSAEQVTPSRLGKCEYTFSPSTFSPDRKILNCFFTPNHFIIGASDNLYVIRDYRKAFEDWRLNDDDSGTGAQLFKSSALHLVLTACDSKRDILTGDGNHQGLAIVMRVKE